MLIGLKLDVGFSQDETCRRLYGDRDILVFLRELGFDAVETPVGPETQTDELRDHIACCVGAGLKVSLHPYSEGSIFNVAYFSSAQDNPCRQLHERFLSLAAEAARLQQYPTIVNIHGAAGTDTDSRQYLIDQSIAFFRWAGQWCRQNAPEVGVTVELQISPNADEPRQRIGDKYDELLEIAERSSVGVCWDFGHAYWNTRRYGWPLYPPNALLPHIRHVHCHDVYGSEDHQPLVYGAVPWQESLKLLRDHGFDGRVILEVSPAEFPKAGGIQSLIDSAQALKDVRETWHRLFGVANGGTVHDTHPTFRD
jgi:sugar phosphate isomerase/epimerase